MTANQKKRMFVDIFRERLTADGFFVKDNVFFKWYPEQQFYKFVNINIISQGHQFRIAFDIASYAGGQLPAIAKNVESTDLDVLLMLWKNAPYSPGDAYEVADYQRAADAFDEGFFPAFQKVDTLAAACEHHWWLIELAHKGMTPPRTKVYECLQLNRLDEAILTMERSIEGIDSNIQKMVKELDEMKSRPNAGNAAWIESWETTIEKLKSGVEEQEGVLSQMRHGDFSTIQATLNENLRSVDTACKEYFKRRR